MKNILTPKQEIAAVIASAKMESANVDTLRATAAALRAAAAEAKAKAKAATTEYQEYKETTVDDDEPDTAARALLVSARRAREAADQAAEAAEAAALRAAEAAGDMASYMHGTDCIALYRYETDADIAARAAALRAAEAQTAAEAAARAAEEADPAHAAEAKAKAKAAAKKAAEAKTAARAAEKAARIAAEDAEAAAVCFGLDVNTDRPGVSLSVAYAHAETISQYLPMPEKIAETVCTLDICAHPEHTLAAARTVAKRTAANAVAREGSKTQWSIYLAARAAKWDNYDLADMTAAAADALCIVNADMDALKRDWETANVMHQTARKLDKIAAADTIAREAVINKAVRLAKNDPRLIDDADKLRARSDAMWEAIAAAVQYRQADDNTVEKAAAIHDANHAAYMAVNGYLSDSRSIRIDRNAPALDVDAIADTIADPRSIAAEATTEYDTRRRAYIRAALPVLRERLTPVQWSVLQMVYRCNGDISAAAVRLNRHKKTVQEHMEALTAVFRDVLAEIAPDSVEAAAVNLSAYMASLDAADITAQDAAEKAARRAEVKARAAKAAEGKAATEAVRARAAAELAEVKAESAAAVASAVMEAVEALPPVMRETVRLLGSGMSKKAVAAHMGKGRTTVIESAKAAAAKIAAAIAAADRTATIDPEIIAAADIRALLAIAAR